MFGFGSFSHLLVVLVLALILLGPKQLPEVARTLGRLFTELRRASNMFTEEFRTQMRDEEHQRIIRPSAPTAEVPPAQAASEPTHQPEVLPGPTTEVASKSEEKKS